MSTMRLGTGARGRNARARRALMSTMRRSPVEPRRKPGMIAGCDPPDLSSVSPIRIGLLASALCRRLLVSSVIPSGASSGSSDAQKETTYGVCGRIHRGVYDRTVRRVRDLSCGGMRIFVEIELRRVACRRCGAVKRELCLRAPAGLWGAGRSSGAVGCGAGGRDGLGTGARGRGARARRALMSTMRCAGWK